MKLDKTPIDLFRPGAPLDEELTATKLNRLVNAVNQLRTAVADNFASAEEQLKFRGWVLGLITDAGPNGEDDYADNRFWVKFADIDPALESGDAAALVEIPEGGINEIVTATWLNGDAHSLAVDTPVRLHRVMQGGLTQHWFFETGGAGGAVGVFIKLTGTLSGDGRYLCKEITAPTSDRTSTGTLSASDFGTLDSVEHWAFNEMEIGRTGHALDTSLLTDIYFAASLLYTQADGTKVYRFRGFQPEDCNQEA